MKRIFVRLALLPLLLLPGAGCGADGLDPSKARDPSANYVSADAKRFVLRAPDLPDGAAVAKDEPIDIAKLKIDKLNALKLLGGHQTRSSLKDKAVVISIGLVWKDLSTASNALTVLKETTRAGGPSKVKTQEVGGPALGDDRFTFEIAGKMGGLVVAWRRNNAVMIVQATRPGGFGQQEMLGLVGAVDVRVRK